MDNKPIGILDSGIGGLTVWREILSLLPQESTIYIGDSANAPYGDKDPQEIHQLARKLILFLLKKKVKLIVVACNVITTTCIDSLRNEFKDIPIIGTVPVVKKAAEKTRKKRIGILSTNGTAKSLYQKHLVEQYASGVYVLNRGTNRLVPLIEHGELEGVKIETLLKKDLEPFLKEKVDVIALGCTHFPFVKNSIQKILGTKILLLDSGEAIARQVRRILENKKALIARSVAKHSVYTTGKKDALSFIFDKAKLPFAELAYISLE